MTVPFHDHFSERAEGYARFRPSYPRELIEFLADQTQAAVGVPLIAWEAGCGSGQLTAGLAERFDRVLATDASAEQLGRARPSETIEYRVARAESCGLPDASVGLAVAAQAAHWFDLKAYYREVRRVVRSGGLIALVVYGLHAMDDPILNRILQGFYGTTLSSYWSPQRQLVEEEYRTIEFPFEEIPSPRFAMQESWSLNEMLGYVATWSATASMIKAGGQDVFDEFCRTTGEAWGDPDVRRIIRWPLSMRIGKVG